MPLSSSPTQQPPHTGRIGTLVPAGPVAAELTTEVHASAARELHPRFVELVRETSDPFMQVIRDAAVPRMVFGRACASIRPKDESRVAQQAQRLQRLRPTLRHSPPPLAADPGDPDAAMRAWEEEAT